MSCPRREGTSRPGMSHTGAGAIAPSSARCFPAPSASCSSRAQDGAGPECPSPGAPGLWEVEQTQTGRSGGSGCGSVPGGYTSPAAFSCTLYSLLLFTFQPMRASSTVPTTL